VQRVAEMSDRAQKGHWLLTITGPPGGMSPCEEYYAHAVAQMDLLAAANLCRVGTPIALAFPSAMLEAVALVEWESAILSPTTMYGPGQAVSMSFLYVFLALETVRQGAKVLFEDYASFDIQVPETAWSRCQAAFDGEGWQQMSGELAEEEPASFQHQAHECSNRGGTYFVWRTSLSESSYEVSWPNELAAVFRGFLGAHQFSDEEWHPFEHCGVCSPPAAKCSQAQWPALGWHLLMKHKLGAADFFAGLSVPEAVDVQPWGQPVDGADT